ncbi:PDR/VanB family oxidoreductase [Polaromonas sp.]|uniref:PDR/VanB family oxidoreductase n=1 Tax=Polaromonas sp. TaxID=1869339 RepID=UPI002731856D|nr:PDR/VanB family oxidoreductase [Polaromonas sp.]MDP2451669.1 PDR/VanB family oxidoreductase [Polaromonas sp.]
MNYNTEPALMLRIARAAAVADGIRSFELVPPAGQLLPAFTSGAHIRVRTPAGTVRKYSLCNHPDERDRYVIAVKRDASGRGGSVSMVDDAAEGDMLAVWEPENAFRMSRGTRRYLFIAGGIGITPILSMIRSLQGLDAQWQLVYLARSAATTPFVDELKELGTGSQVRIHHDEGDPARALDLWPWLEKPQAEQHVYCCGPRPLMDAVRDMSGHWNAGKVHFESFTDGSVARKNDHPFTVHLARSGKTLQVAVGQSILEAARGAGVQVAASCESGTCGTCRTSLLAGQADHRDMVLMPEELSSQIMVCVSRAVSGELTLDL